MTGRTQNNDVDVVLANTDGNCPDSSYEFITAEDPLCRTGLIVDGYNGPRERKNKAECRNGAWPLKGCFLYTPNSNKHIYYSTCTENSHRGLRKNGNAQPRANHRRLCKKKKPTSSSTENLVVANASFRRDGNFKN